tara:strand:+ start:440 stop:577 length:138 start_codon:yes stop_codon:yes gene_type:complete
LAEKLSKSASEIMQMTVQEFNMWLAYYEIQQEEKERDQRLQQARR